MTLEGQRRMEAEALRSRQSDIAEGYNQYLSQHTDLRSIMNDFLTSVLMNKPTDIHSYAGSYFDALLVDKSKGEEKVDEITAQSVAKAEEAQVEEEQKS